MSTAVTLITEQVRERVRRDGVDLGGDRARSDHSVVDRYVREEVRRYSERALGGSLPMLQSTGRRVDLSSNFVDGSLPDRHRICCLGPCHQATAGRANH